MRTERLTLESFVVEVASNDGYLLRNFVKRGIRVLGVDPARNIAATALERGVPTLSEFFGADLAGYIAGEHGRANLIVANNVLAHVPDLHDFIAGIAALLSANGVASFEFPHLLELLGGRQFDTIYHEHFSYLT
ncbi:MAG TPA: methyltransferase domain-containing protein, partial [Trueperaceae bacterium]|nr:methyltransferase domain-containing protein [Trueperaceae bacterium]